ncbi:BnaC03g62250D [Brassica napus]|uniref:BnaC03g62250D protein n=2 Tax=Brassica TaxID=3705 RepID=A0A078HW82_BRANA|nr:BnaC03g62250D [Brassica napus]VDC98972.1 unnamed protein product [Brassica oleracea]
MVFTTQHTSASATTSSTTSGQTSYINSLGTSLNTIKRTVKFLFPAEIIPPYIEVNLSLLDVGQKLVAGDLKVHLALRLIRPKDEPIVKIAGGRVSDQQKKDQPKKDQPKK